MLLPATAESAAATTAHDVAQAQLDEHGRRRPGWWRALVTFGEARRTWEAKGAPLRVAEQAADTRRKRAQADTDDARSRLTALRRDLAAAQSRRSDLIAEGRGLERQCAADRERWGAAYPDASWFRDDERRERTAPWSNPELNAARTEAFLAALDDPAGQRGQQLVRQAQAGRRAGIEPGGAADDLGRDAAAGAARAGSQVDGAGAGQFAVGPAGMGTDRPSTIPQSFQILLDD